MAVYHHDELGSVRAITDGSANITKTYQTDEFCMPIAAGTQGASIQSFTYTSEQADPENGPSYLRAHLYDLGLGRFLERDSAPGSRTVPLSLNDGQRC